MSKTCLVLEGGAMRGIYTAGVIDALLETDIKIDAVIGVSAGALFGINLLSKQSGRALRYNLNYVGNKNYMGFYSLFTTGNVANEDFCFNKLVHELDPFDFDTYNKSKTKFYATVTNLETGKPEYIQIVDCEKDKEYLRASGSMPLFSKIVTIGNNKYLDGAISDSIPVKKALDMGYDKVIVVTTQVDDYIKKPYKMLPFNIAYRKYKNFLTKVKNRHILYNDTLKEVHRLRDNGKIFLVSPSKKVKISHLEKNKEIIKEQYNLGYNDFKESLKDLNKYLKNR